MPEYGDECPECGAEWYAATPTERAQGIKTIDHRWGCPNRPIPKIGPPDIQEKSQ